MASKHAKQLRQVRIQQLVERNRVSSHEQLMALLQTESISTTQATLSRDLRELRITKRNGAYALPRGNDLARTQEKELQRALRGEVISAERAGQFVILRTEPGLANAAAIRIDEMKLSSIIGTIAGTDTVMIATPAWRQAEELVRMLHRIARLS